MEAQKEFMQKAIEIAKNSAKDKGYAIGAVVVKENKIISTGETLFSKHPNDPTAHAEINAIKEACKKLNSSTLDDCVLYSTHEPCPMCASTAIWAKMKGIVFGAPIEDAFEYANSKSSEKFSWRQINIKSREVLSKGEPKLELIENFMREDCKNLFKLSK